MGTCLPEDGCLTISSILADNCPLNNNRCYHSVRHKTKCSGRGKSNKREVTMAITKRKNNNLSIVMAMVCHSNLMSLISLDTSRSLTDAITSLRWRSIEFKHFSILKKCESSMLTSWLSCDSINGTTSALALSPDDSEVPSLSVLGRHSFTPPFSWHVFLSGIVRSSFAMTFWLSNKPCLTRLRRTARGRGCCWMVTHNMRLSRFIAGCNQEYTKTWGNGLWRKNLLSLWPLTGMISLQWALNFRWLLGWKYVGRVASQSTE